MSATSSRQRPLLYAGFGPLSGFPETESLTGFLSRLCAARGILITDALDHLVRPLVPPGIVPPRRDLSKFLKRAIVRYDGMGPSAAHVARALEHLTGVSRLAYLTFVPWQRAFSASSTGAVLMHGKRWCARCFASWHEQGLPFYEPLLWRLAPVVRCPEHRVRLSDRCPSCGRAPRLVTQTVPPGHCERCGHLLYRADPRLERDDFAVRDAGGDALWEWWTALALGRMCAIGSWGQAYATPDGFAALLRETTARPDVALAPLARYLGVNPATLTRWRSMKTKPRLRQFLDACIRLGAIPVTVATGSKYQLLDFDPCPWKRALPATPQLPPRVFATSSRHARDQRDARLRRALDRMMAEGACRSVPEVERALCVPAGTLSRRFPDRYGKLRAVCAARRDHERHRLLSRCCIALDEAIEGPEVRSVHDLARSLRVGSESLRRWFPERFHRLVEVYAERSTQRRHERLALRLRAIRDAVSALVDGGELPSLHRALRHAGLPSTFDTDPRARAAWVAALAHYDIPPLPYRARSTPFPESLISGD